VPIGFVGTIWSSFYPISRILALTVTIVILIFVSTLVPSADMQRQKMITEISFESLSAST